MNNLKLTRKLDPLAIVLILFAFNVSLLALLDPAFRPTYAELVKLIFSGFLGYLIPKK